MQKNVKTEEIFDVLLFCGIQPTDYLNATFAIHEKLEPSKSKRQKLDIDEKSYSLKKDTCFVSCWYLQKVLATLKINNQTAQNCSFLFFQLPNIDCILSKIVSFVQLWTAI